MTVDEELNKAVKDVAKAKIAEALGGDVIAKIVEEVMNHQQSVHGRNPERFFDRIVRDAIQCEIAASVSDFIKGNETFKATIEKAIREKADKFAVSISDAFSSGDWRANLSVTIERDSD